MRLKITQGRVLDPASKTDGIYDILVEDGRIVKLDTQIEEEADQVIDASGFYVMPGLIDLHVHFREPGFEYKETIATGSAAAAKGGFTGVCPMANTNPVVDTPEMIRWILKKGEEVSPVHLYPIGAVTYGLKGEQITDAAAMKAAGMCALSEDGKTVMDARVYRDALRQAAANDIVVMDHCEDANLLKGGAMHAGKKADSLGLIGISHAVEDVITARDILLAKETGAHLHLCHCSTAGSVRMAREAKEDGVHLTAEVCPHHFTLTVEDIPEGDANFKMAPPLRDAADVQALKEGLRDGIIDAISTDHAPHSVEEKTNPEFAKNANGIVGLETAVSLVISELVEPGWLTPLQMAEKMSYRPAQILGIEAGELKVGRAADITIIDPSAEYVIDKNTFASKGRNTPFHGRKVHGRVMATIVDGKVVYQAE
ncbi:MAG: dihydroorotase [Lachnospiraceae bacterium]